MHIQRTSLFKVGLSLLVLIPLIGCVQVPHPFEKQSGVGGKLTAPPPTRLIVPVPTEALLTDKDSAILAQDLVKVMTDQTLPPVVGPAQKGEWLLLMKANSKDGMVTPQFSIIAPDGKVAATRQMMPVSAQDWSSGNEAILAQVAEQTAPMVTDVLKGLEARVMAADPHSLKNRPAQVYFEGVTGAPGDGNKTISRQFVASFVDKSNAIQLKKEKADYIVNCIVKLTSGAAGTRGNPVQHVEIVWRIVDAKGKEAGKAFQINDVPAHSLDVYWGDVGAAVGQEAAGAVQRIINNHSERNVKPLPTNGEKTQGPLLAPPDLQKTM
ncbi:hypothetical protein [Commensalibacter papalotli (ex Servin-Garciduenas et al. 2014)]|uniref:Lipoprotein n=1 Tax=Commensalibacter papalotli (ex Servin-Garciduenas et al. 2014) TaxID=1208583 RepID=W7DTH7_9PROT|nr:hypothetical protein [Commensalibacter papalotli (ex Servin-Garciduenas et al. 2014)]EUK17573.1 hypothetical protein COMX_08946 [Commensalibacter papalotli (ex Servin-Garciduenas et al. 2014)]